MKHSYPVTLANISQLSLWLADQVEPPQARRGYVGRIPPHSQRAILERLGTDWAVTRNYNVLQAWFPSKDPIEIHSDRSPFSGDVHRSLIIPIKNCEHLTWSWYRCTDESKTFQQDAQGQYNTVPMLPVDAAEVVESRLCDQPFVADINTWHSLCNASSEPAQLISIRILPWACVPWDQAPSLPPVSSVTF
jgi:hypothetical protein